MKKISRIIIVITVLLMIGIVALSLNGCTEAVAIDGSKQDTKNTITTVSNLQNNQPTPTDINYSLERYNLIRRAYWVNGQREKANALVCQVEKPLGYIALFTESGAVIDRFIVDGKVTSLNSYLT